MSDPHLPAVEVLGVRVHALTVDELHAEIKRRIRAGVKSLVLHANVHGLNLAYGEPWLRDLLNRAEIVFCDGAGVMLAARLLGGRIPERITYADWMWQLAAFAERENVSLYLLGAQPGVGDAAAERLRARHPALRIVGVSHGYFNKAARHPENEAVVAQINAARPDILLVAFGMPAQERWLLENWGAIDARVALTGGAVFDYISGRLRRGPRWMTDNGFEWLARLLIEPRRLWQRYIVGNPLFLCRVLLQRLRR